MEKKAYTIYMHRNIVNGKIFIGRTCQKIPQCWGQNGDKYFRNLKFKTDIDKIG